jgi:precorrin-6B methylase 2
VIAGNGYKSHQSAAVAVAKVFPEDERSQKVTLDIGAGTGLVAEEVSIRFLVKTQLQQFY